VNCSTTPDLTALRVIGQYGSVPCEAPHQTFQKNQISTHLKTKDTAQKHHYGAAISLYATIIS
jgi:hypothetical protein